MPAYAMDDAERDSDLGDNSPLIARFPNAEPPRSDDFADQSSESSDESVTRENHRHPAPPPGPMPHHVPPPPPAMGRPLNMRENFESFKTSLHPHLSSLVSLAQGASLSTTNNVFAIAGGTGNFYNPPAFVAPAQPPPPPPQQPVGSASSSSSEGSAAGWSFEEQYKQLYEINDDPQRKEFLDDLFAFMQRRGTPITRLPVMAKTVLDLCELYNLVVARGGLVAVINKKLWQEIIKGLNLPSSITSAAFTLRTQYMRFLYDYECHKKNFSTKAELDVAIEGNKREGRRHSVAANQYAQEVQAQAALSMPQFNRMPSVASYTQHMQPVLPGGGPIPHLPSLPLHPSQYSQRDMENLQKLARMIQEHQREFLRNAESPPSAMDMTQMWWNLYNPQTVNLEPQREALNLAESPSNGIKREASPPPAAPPKRRVTHSSSMSISPSRSPHYRSPIHSPRTARAPRSVSPRTSVSPRAVSPHVSPRVPAHNLPTPPPSLTHSHNGTASILNGASFRITSKGDTSTGDQELNVSIDLNGITYEGILYPSQNGM
ncbi:protein dead ringer isoform X2 [Aricia agestis]|uniref:protein dead ringer isoform X2 n=1 Tax=Aricia agestis TaxID=91739 RepID=UPI001C201678|nr:protein dead ringer isoform X2 [Aricia agestis]